MAGKSGLKMDERIARANLRKLHKAGMDARGPMLESISLLKFYADEVEPKTPHDKGQLVATAKIYITKEGDKYVAQLWYIQPYAARWHFIKVPINWSKPGHGSFYLETKINRFHRQITGVLAAAIGEKLKAAI